MADPRDDIEPDEPWDGEAFGWGVGNFELDDRWEVDRRQEPEEILVAGCPECLSAGFHIMGVHGCDGSGTEAACSRAGCPVPVQVPCSGCNGSGVIVTLAADQPEPTDPDLEEFLAEKAQLELEPRVRRVSENLEGMLVRGLDHWNPERYWRVESVHVHHGLASFYVMSERTKTSVLIRTFADSDYVTVMTAQDELDAAEAMADAHDQAISDYRERAEA